MFNLVASVIRRETSAVSNTAHARADGMYQTFKILLNRTGNLDNYLTKVIERGPT